MIKLHKTVELTKVPIDLNCYTIQKKQTSLLSSCLPSVKLLATGTKDSCRLFREARALPKQEYGARWIVAFANGGRLSARSFLSVLGIGSNATHRVTVRTFHRLSWPNLLYRTIRRFKRSAKTFYMISHKRLPWPRQSTESCLKHNQVVLRPLSL